jgi:hypothetical protein
MDQRGFLGTYFLNKTYEVRAPDDIDPARTKPNVPVSWTESDNVGYSNPISDSSRIRGRVANTKTYGTDRFTAIELVESGLNLRLPAVYDEVEV